MSYNGYRLKINNTIFPNEYISRGTFNISNNPRVCDSYVDSLGISHDVYYPTSKAIINFSVKEHSTDEHSTLSAFFVSRSNVTVEYYDDNEDEYVTGSFKVNPFDWSHNNALNDSIDYASTNIVLEEY